MDTLTRVPVNAPDAVVHEHGWQSWSPTAAYRLDDRVHRPVSEARRIGSYRPDRSAPTRAFWGEGLLAVDPGTGEGVHVAGPRVERREEWAAVVERHEGLRSSSDRLRELDERGLATTRRLLRRGFVSPFVR